MTIDSFYAVPKVIVKDMFDSFCGTPLGYGIGRQVYEHRHDPSLVIKIEYASNSFQNVLEYEAWQYVKETIHAKHFAPCVYISPCGTVLIQKKTDKAKKYPDRLPVFLTDTKRANYGVYKGHFCCHDYGFTNLMTTGLTKRTRKIDWLD